MILGLLVMITALSISAVAIYYSVAGLVAIFAAAAVPIIVMGSTLEIAKLVTAVWLHHYWKQTSWWLKGYLSAAVIMLMFITSMGIFGFLSKAHIEQTANASEGVAQIERNDQELLRQQEIVSRAQQRIAEADSSIGNNNNEIQLQIDREQQRIDTAYNRIQPAIDEQLEIINNNAQAIEVRIQPLLSQATNIEAALSNLSIALASNEVRAAQGIVGEEQDGTLGPSTSRKIQEYRVAEEGKRTGLLAQVETIRTAPQQAVTSAREEITRIRATADAQINQSNALIQSLRETITVGKDVGVEETIVQQQQTIIEANITIDALTQQKYEFQAEYRKLEAEVGPLKYLAEFVYGESADSDMLEEAVRWVILMIIFVFDPLAVLLLIASQATFDMRKEAKLKAKRELAETQKESLRLSKEELNQQVEEIIYQAAVEQEENKNEQKSSGSDDSKDDTQLDFFDIITNEAVPIGTGTKTDGGDAAQRVAVAVQLRQQELEIKEEDQTYKNAKHSWKSDHPDQTVKRWKDLYIKGKIDSLPWESDTYIQNSEQSTESLWQKLRSKDE